MERRQLLWGAGASAVAIAGPAVADDLPVPPGNRLAFKVLRNGTIIGEHDLNFTRAGADLAVAINIALVVSVLGIPAFRYTASATERWSGGVFQSLDSQINDNGTQMAVHIRKIAAGYNVQGINHTNPAKSYPQYTAPPNSMPLTYWNKNFLYGTIINIQTAHSYPAIVTSPGWNRLPTANGGTLTAQRFDVTGKLHLSVWYDQMNQWSGLEFHLSGDETYEKIIT